MRPMKEKCGVVTDRHGVEGLSVVLCIERSWGICGYEGD